MVPRLALHCDGVLVGCGAACVDLGGDSGSLEDGQRNMGRSQRHLDVAQVRSHMLTLAITKGGGRWYRLALSKACLAMEIEKNAWVFWVITQSMDGSWLEAKSQL